MLELGYWKIRGFAQPIRLLLQYARVPWKETRYEVRQTATGEWDRSEWTDVKFHLGLDFPNLPWMIDGNLRLTESTAIIRHIARKYQPELLGKNIEDMVTLSSVHTWCSSLHRFLGTHTRHHLCLAVVSVCTGSWAHTPGTTCAWQ
eukprot:GHVS01040965.1.p2 GENE.GHVS01040965.1~~GHVS01040965.1.p2  ORF type:complete len:146 (+),score=11.45 GHVS01040965.1:267-704(+)